MLLLGGVCAAYAQLLPAATLPAPSTTLRLTHAQYLSGYCADVPPPAGTAGINVQLPLLLDSIAAHDCSAGRWLRIPLPPMSARRQAVYLSHALPNSAIYLNGNFLGASDGFDDPTARAWNYPQYLYLPTSLLRAGTNDILIESIPRGDGLTQLSPLLVGDRTVLRALYLRQEWLQVTGVELVSVLVGVIGCFALLLWLRRRRESIFGLFALSCGLWILRNAQFFVVHEYSVFGFELITDAALFWLAAVLYSLCLRIVERRVRWAERAVYGYALLATLAMWLGGPRYKPLITLVSYVLLLPMGAMLQVHLTREAWHSPTVVRCLLWLATIVTIASGAHDLALMVGLIPWQLGFLMPYSAMFYALTVFWALVDRFVLTHSQFEQLNAQLESRVRERERELETHYERVWQLEREQAVAGERDRILRNMHDGLGLHLIAALRLLERSEPRPGTLGAQLHSMLVGAMDELRIAIDSMKASGQDLLVMLGNLRYRLEPRLSAAGITLHWQVGSLLESCLLGTSEVADITRIVQELCTNAIKHSRATDMYLTVESIGAAQLRITIVDHGVGYDTSAPRVGEGLRSIRRRAEALGATLEMHSRPGHTQVTLLLNVIPVGDRTPTTLPGGEAARAAPGSESDQAPVAATVRTTAAAD